MTRQRKNFSFRFEWSAKIAHLPASTRLEIYEAAVKYAENGSKPPMSAQAEAAFEEFILPDFRKRERAAMYRERAKARKAERTTEPELPAAQQEMAVETTEPQHEKSIVSGESSPGEKTPALPKLNRRQRRRIEQEQRRISRKKSKIAG